MVQDHKREPRTSLAACLFTALACALAAPPAGAQDGAELARLINAYRSAPQACKGRRLAPAAPLTPEAALAGVRIVTGTFLEQELEDRGYPVERAQAVSVSGPPDAQSALAAILPQYCAVLLDPQFSAVGVVRKGNEWQVVLARPLILPTLPGWPETGQTILAAVNTARAAGRTCGDRFFGAAPALSWNQALGEAALAHSQDMAEHRYFSHTGSDGTVVGDRARQAGYQWRRVGENIAAGLGTPEEAVAGWLGSPLHCANLMDPGFTEMGAAYAVNPRSKTRRAYWTQVFGTR